MNTIDAMERHQRIRLICHAIRHLLDYAPDQTNDGDLNAIDILQSAINPANNDSAPVGELPRQAQEASIAHIPAAS